MLVIVEIFFVDNGFRNLKTDIAENKKSPLIPSLEGFFK